MLTDPAYGGQAEVVEALLTALNKTVLNIEVAKRGQSVVGKQREGLHVRVSSYQTSHALIMHRMSARQSSHTGCVIWYPKQDDA